MALRVPSLFSFLCAGLFAALLAGCWPSEPAKGGPPWDTAFTVGNVRFPNDTAYGRALLTPGPNARVARFLEKCRARDTVRIGFLGGSITDGAGATAHAFRYSSLLSAFVKNGFPSLKKVVEINGGVGATGSRFGASRVGEDVLAASPDLVVVEFAVNDWEAGSDAHIRAWMEGIVRQALRDPDAAVILLFTAKGDGRNTQALHAQVAAHYGIPMISYRDAIWPLIESGALPWEAVFLDDPHPNNGGHRIAAHLLYTYLKNAPAAGAVPAVPAPAFDGLFESARILHAGDTAVRVVSAGWTASTDAKGRRSYVSGTDSSTLTLTTRRRELTLAYRVRPSDTSSVRIVVDGLPDVVVNNRAGFEYMRFAQVFLDTVPTLRTVRVAHPQGKAFTVDYVLYAGEPE